jgi:hypothetical protein
MTGIDFLSGVNTLLLVYIEFWHFTQTGPGVCGWVGGGGGGLGACPHGIAFKKKHFTQTTFR